MWNWPLRKFGCRKINCQSLYVWGKRIKITAKKETLMIDQTKSEKALSFKGCKVNDKTLILIPICGYSGVALRLSKSRTWSEATYLIFLELPKILISIFFERFQLDIISSIVSSPLCYNCGVLTVLYLCCSSAAPLIIDHVMAS